jgi:hypothetical protein
MKNLQTHNPYGRSIGKGRQLVAFSLLAAGSLSAGAVPTAKQDLDRNYTLTASELVGAVVVNELTDREQLWKWICTIEKHTGKQSLTELQVETKDGPLFRLVAIDGAELSPDQRKQDDTRIARLIKDPRPLQKLKQAQQDDEIRLQKLITLMPQAFVYDYDGLEGNLVRIKFRPNPLYVPPTYEARVIHSLAGKILIDSVHKRLASVAGQLTNRVDFGFGLLGRIDNGTVEIARIEVGPQLWKTAFINIHFSGRLALFKTISKDQYERRSGFHTVSADLTLSDANALLISRDLQPQQTLSSSQ